MGGPKTKADDAVTVTPGKTMPAKDDRFGPGRSPSGRAETLSLHPWRCARASRQNVIVTLP